MSANEDLAIGKEQSTSSVKIVQTVITRRLCLMGSILSFINVSNQIENPGETARACGQTTAHPGRAAGVAEMVAINESATLLFFTPKAWAPISQHLRRYMLRLLMQPLTAHGF